MKTILSLLMIFSASAFATEVAYDISCKVTSNRNLLGADKSHSMAVIVNLSLNADLSSGEATVARKNGGPNTNPIIEIFSEKVGKKLSKRKITGLRFVTEEAIKEGGDGYGIYLPADFTKKQNFNAEVTRFDDGTGAEGDDFQGQTESDPDAMICTHTSFVK